MMATALEQRSIIVGEVFASDRPAVVSTVLGSCVAACLFDPVTAIGGMNHFMLPDSKQRVMSASFGIHAMELLINRIMQLGGDRRRLQAKVFGGGNVLALQGAQLQVGQRNVEFVLQFLADEEIPLVAQRVGGSSGIKLCFYTHTHQAMVKPLPNRALGEAIMQEVQFIRKKAAQAPPPEQTVQLFE